MTELMWDGKYKDGKKVGPVRIQLPFQTVETVNESTHQRQMMLDLFTSGQPTEWRNRLIWGDKKYVLPSLLPEFASKVNLIYIDPPFATGADFSFTAAIPETDESFTKEPSVIEQKAYRDTWGRGLDSYLQWFYETIILLRDLLAENGSAYIHCDYHVGFYLKAVLDEVFGADNFKNEIIWKRSLPHNDPKKYGAIHDIILFYVKSGTYTFNQQ
ncbi:MAG TPA: site-specific DNA-methyltransferase, partial [Ktedonobacteraceae bacterium]|nr:site-specific DNA-methyltransferase [Ktedonobacteraceae bacterium]